MENRKETTGLADLLAVLNMLEETGIVYWLDGGWGVDALLGRQTREHRDIDIDFDAERMGELMALLQGRGYEIDTDWRPARVELYSRELGYLDIHPFALNAQGRWQQADMNGGWYVFEDCFFGRGWLGGREIPCISLAGQQAFHSGYELREKDRLDLATLAKIAQGGPPDNQGIYVDLAATREYYAKEAQGALCDCAYCRNFCRQVRAAYPTLAAYLAGLGVAIELPWELAPIEAFNGTDSEAREWVEYLVAQYVVLGRCGRDFAKKIGDLELRRAEYYPTVNLAAEHFVLELCGVRLPWLEAEE